MAVHSLSAWMRGVPSVGVARWLGIGVLWLALGLLYVGLTEPILRLEKFWVFESTTSVWGGTMTLLAEREYFLGWVILLFSIAFPIVKNLLMLLILHLRLRSTHLLHWLAVLGKWSMLDVFLCALLVASIKLGAVAKAELQPGVYYFASAIILTNLVSTVLDWRQAEND
ncbi:paraquat-inducible protein A [bacterium]|nr:paraquat-inducible protein A [bacterium]